MKQRPDEGGFIQDVIHGGLTGTITTFAVVSGITGASLGANIILIIGSANLLAHGFTIAISNYLGIEAKNKYTNKERKQVTKDILSHLNASEEELEKFYRKHHYTKDEANKLVHTLVKHKQTFADTIMDEELHIENHQESPLKTSLVTFFSFLFFGFVPLFSYVLDLFSAMFIANPFVVATSLTGATIFGLGTFKAALTDKHWFASGLQILILGGAAALIAFYVGSTLSHFA
ncbi:MAG: VIT1/CCC1 transporter family protein [Candidatus Woesearchaeota archaeon]